MGSEMCIRDSLEVSPRRRESSEPEKLAEEDGSADVRRVMRVLGEEPVRVGVLEAAAVAKGRGRRAVDAEVQEPQGISAVLQVNLDGVVLLVDEVMEGLKVWHAVVPDEKDVVLET